MKLSTSAAIAAAVLAFSAAAHAQTAQTFHFGEGQSGMQPAHADNAQPTGHTPPKTLVKRKAQHHRPAHHSAAQPDTYSHN